MIKKIHCNALVINITIALIIILLFKDFIALYVYILGCSVSHINFFLNCYLLDLSGTNKVFIKNITSFGIRMLLYMIVLTYVIFSFGEIYVLGCFLGCLSIRYAILISTIFRKEGEYESD